MAIFNKLACLVLASTLALCTNLSAQTDAPAAEEKKDTPPQYFRAG